MKNIKGANTMKKLLLSATLVLAASAAQGAGPQSKAKLIFNIIQPPPGLTASIDFTPKGGGTHKSMTGNGLKEVPQGVYSVWGTIFKKGSGTYPRCTKDPIEKNFEAGKTYVLTISPMAKVTPPPMANLTPPGSQTPPEEPLPECKVTIQER